MFRLGERNASYLRPYRSRLSFHGEFLMSLIDAYEIGYHDGFVGCSPVPSVSLAIRHNATLTALYMQGWREGGDDADSIDETERSFFAC
jgi:hypothetical protein